MAKYNPKLTNNHDNSLYEVTEEVVYEVEIDDDGKELSRTQTSSYIKTSKPRVKRN
jgi:hypothetical protein